MATLFRAANFKRPEPSETEVLARITKLYSIAAPEEWSVAARKAGLSTQDFVRRIALSELRGVHEEE